LLVVAQPHRRPSDHLQPPSDPEKPETEADIGGDEVGDADHVKVEVEGHVVQDIPRAILKESAPVGIDVDIRESRVVKVQRPKDVDDRRDEEAKPKEGVARRSDQPPFIGNFHRDLRQRKGEFLVVRPLSPQNRSDDEMSGEQGDKKHRPNCQR